MRDDDDGNLEFDAWTAVADASSSSSCAFLDFLKRRGATDVFATHVLDGGALDADDRGVFARVSAACRDVADASRLPRAGNDGVPLRVRAHASSVARMRWARFEQMPVERSRLRHHRGRRLAGRHEVRADGGKDTVGRQDRAESRAREPPRRVQVVLRGEAPNAGAGGEDARRARGEGGRAEESSALAGAARRRVLIITRVPIRPRSRGERRFLRTLSPGVSLRPGSPAFNPDTPRRLSTPLLTPFNSAGPDVLFARIEWQEEHLVEWDRHASCVDDAEFRAWDVCAAAAEGGHLEFLEYAMHRVNWDHHMSAFAARAGQVRVLRWLRRARVPVGRGRVFVRGSRELRDAAVAVERRAREYRERGDVRAGCARGVPGNASVVPREGVSVGFPHADRGETPRRLTTASILRPRYRLTRGNAIQSVTDTCMHSTHRRRRTGGTSRF